MKTKQISCAIFAIATVATAALMTTGCNKDEEYDLQTYDDEYTLAEPMMTRSTEGGSGTLAGIAVSDSTIIDVNITLSRKKGSQTISYDANIHLMFLKNGKNLRVELIDYTCIEPLCTVESVGLRNGFFAGTYILTASGRDNEGVCCYGEDTSYIYTN